MDDRKTYIENNDDKEALSGYLKELGALSPGVEEISPVSALFRVSAEAVYAKMCDPTYNAAAMDGIAVAAEKTADACESRPLRLVEGRDFEYINTGGALTESCNAVIMIEDVIKVSDSEVEIIAPAYPWQHVRVIGESIVAGEMVIPSNHVIGAADIGAIIASGNTRVKVYRKPRVGIIPTGAEMTENPDELCSGRLMESNSKVFAALVTQYGGETTRYTTSPDEPFELKKRIERAVSENDIVIVNAGSSAGTKDHTVKVIGELGKVVVHGVAIKPGKPTILGIIAGKPVLGIPGYPVSAYLVFEMFARPLILALAGRRTEEGEFVQAVLTRRITSSFKNAELIRMALGEVGGRLVATPRERGAAAIMSLVRADGLLRVDRLTEGIEAGESVPVKLMKPLSEIKKSLVIIGSHDMIIDVIADKIPISSAHVGSMGGIFAMERGECHIAPIHLLDEESGEYNVPYVKKYFKGRKMALIKGVGRVQGFLTLAGNPKNIYSLNDIEARNLTYANRQRGAGTRILFDYMLKKSGIRPSDILGYEKEFGTHLAVAAAVKNGVADTGLAVLSAAKALELDFSEVANEQYDFLLPFEYLADERVGAFIEVLKSEYFKTKLAELGGYTMDGIGDIVEVDG
ncbi:MAG: molybdopterin biosynthesis protein [Christensenellales bacterium]|jgi:putative molybdopterin biosynthesis protein|nr:molybdopterin biosynthesis protein [Eubacteriales bacterium]